MLGSIERKFHYVWEGDSFPYLNLLAVRSLRWTHPDADIVVHFVNRVPDDVTVVSLSRDLDVTVNLVDPTVLLGELEGLFTGLTELYTRLPVSAVSARSNLVRYAILWKFGGVYLDLDTIVLDDLETLFGAPAFVGEEIVWSGDAARVAGDRWIYMRPSTWHWSLSWLARRCDSTWFGGWLGMAELLSGVDTRWQALQVNNAVVGSVPESDFLSEVLRRVGKCDPHVRYATGPLLLESVCREHPELAMVHKNDVFYPVAPGESFRLFEDVTMQLPDSSKLVHYASSNHPSIIKETTEGHRSSIRHGSVMDKLIEWLEEGEFDEIPVIGAEAHVAR